MTKFSSSIAILLLAFLVLTAFVMTVGGCGYSTPNQQPNVVLSPATAQSLFSVEGLTFNHHVRYGPLDLESTLLGVRNSTFNATSGLDPLRLNFFDFIDPLHDCAPLLDEEGLPRGGTRVETSSLPFSSSRCYTGPLFVRVLLRSLLALAYALNSSLPSCPSWLSWPSLPSLPSLPSCPSCPSLLSLPSQLSRLLWDSLASVVGRPLCWLGREPVYLWLLALLCLLMTCIRPATTRPAAAADANVDVDDADNGDAFADLAALDAELGSLEDLQLLVRVAEHMASSPRPHLTLPTAFSESELARAKQTWARVFSACRPEQEAEPATEQVPEPAVEVETWSRWFHRMGVLVVQILMRPFQVLAHVSLPSRPAWLSWSSLPSPASLASAVVGCCRVLLGLPLVQKATGCLLALRRMVVTSTSQARRTTPRPADAVTIEDADDDDDDNGVPDLRIRLTPEDVALVERVIAHFESPHPELTLCLAFSLRELKRVKLILDVYRHLIPGMDSLQGLLE